MRPASAGRRRSDETGLGQDKIRHGPDVIEVEDRKHAVRDRMIGSDGRDGRRVLLHRPAIARLLSPALDLGVRLALVALDENQVAGRQPRDDVGKARLGRAAQFVHQRPARARDDRHLAGAGAAVAEGIGALAIDFEGMVGMLDRRDPEAPCGDLGHQPLRQGRLAGVLPASDAEYALFHLAPVPSLHVSRPAGSLPFYARRESPVEMRSVKPVHGARDGEETLPQLDAWR